MLWVPTAGWSRLFRSRLVLLVPLPGPPVPSAGTHSSSCSPPAPPTASCTGLGQAGAKLLLVRLAKEKPEAMCPLLLLKALVWLWVTCLEWSVNFFRLLPNAVTWTLDFKYSGQVHQLPLLEHCKNSLTVILRFKIPLLASFSFYFYCFFFFLMEKYIISFQNSAEKYKEYRYYKTATLAGEDTYLSIVWKK